MNLTTSLAGRVKNTHLPKSHALLPLLEAIVNAIQAIDRCSEKKIQNGTITVEIIRETGTLFDSSEPKNGRGPLNPIIGFSIKDDGEGFTDENMASFHTLDSNLKEDIGCRGVGRLTWLKAFNSIEIESTYSDANGDLKGRFFTFSISAGIEHHSHIVASETPGTNIRLMQFKKEYQQSAPKTLDAIAREVYDHCIWYFLRSEGTPNIFITDGSNSVALKELHIESTYSHMTQRSFRVKNEDFLLHSVQLKPSSRIKNHRIHWSAASRIVKNESLGTHLPELKGKLIDESSSDFYYHCYLSSSFLDTHVRSDRTDFDISQYTLEPSLFSDISMEDIWRELCFIIRDELKQPIANLAVESRERIHSFISEKAPRYRPILRKIDKEGLVIDPSSTDQEIEMELHRAAQKIETELLATGQAVVNAVKDSKHKDVDEKLKEYMKSVTEMHMSDLANYVVRRKTTLDILDHLTQVNTEGTYSREEAIHDLLFPMRKESTEIENDASNLWILDESLVFHDYLASDKKFSSMPITDNLSHERPDIIAIQGPRIELPMLTSEERMPPIRSIVVVELKRPMRDGVDTPKDPITQCLDYVQHIREGKATTSTGRLIPKSTEQPAFCYIIADLTSSMIRVCEHRDLTKTHDGMGYFGYSSHFKAYIEVMSYDRLLSSARKRNQAFFDKLNIPTS